jgi:glyceraldehyde-3-phosphate dehydrogenase (NADP+)
LAERADEAARLITAEHGKPLKWARAEVGRAVSTLSLGGRGVTALLRRGAATGHRPGRYRPVLTSRASRGPVPGITQPRAVVLAGIDL